VRVVARERTTVGVLEDAAREELWTIEVRTTECGEPLLENDPFADHELLYTVLFHDTNCAIAECRFEISLPEVGRLHHVCVAVDH
jgi:hypothetical protein